MRDLKTFQQKVEVYRKNAPTSHSQKDLAVAISLDKDELSKRLNDYKHPVRNISPLTCAQVQAIVSALARWGAIETQEQAKDLLDLMECWHFSDSDWKTNPLDLLRPASTPPKLIQYMPVEQEIEQGLLNMAIDLVKLGHYVPASREEVQQYYKGAPLNWDIIAARGDVERDVRSRLIDAYTAPSSQARMLCLTGESGAGKSTLAWRIAYEVASHLRQPLLQIIDNEDSQIWFKLRKYLHDRNLSVVVLIDDIFRTYGVKRALAQLRLNVGITIVATSRSHEIPRDLRLPLDVRFEELNAPSIHEKTQVLRVLGKSEQKLSHDQRIRLGRANSWLVLMIETTSGQDLTKIIHDNMFYLEKQDNIVFRAYEYLCFVGQYQLFMPETLLANLDGRGHFYKLLERPSSRGIIFTSEVSKGGLQSQHPVIAHEALKYYGRDPVAVARELIDAIQPENRHHRLLLPILFWHALRTEPSQERSFVKVLLKQKAVEIELIIASSGHHELLYWWSKIYQILGEQKKVDDLREAVRNRIPETSIDWTPFFRFIEQEGQIKQVRETIDAASQWLVNNPQDIETRKTYLGLVERQGTTEQRSRIIGETERWLANNPQDSNVRRSYLRLVKRHGTAEQYATAIEETERWLANNPQDKYIYAPYQRLIKRRDTEEQRSHIIEEMGYRLADNPQDSNVRQSYLRQVKREGTLEQSATAIEETERWLANNPQDSNVRKTYLGLVERHGTAEQRSQLIEQIERWLAANPQDGIVRRSYLMLIERQGTPEQRNRIIEQTELWLANNPQDGIVRRSFLRLVKRHGTAEQYVTAVEETEHWLVNNPQDEQVRAVRAEYLRLVEKTH